MCVHAKSLESCPTLFDPMDCSPSGSSVHGIVQARILEWVAASFSRGSSDPGMELGSPALQSDSLLSELATKITCQRLQCHGQQLPELTRSHAPPWDTTCPHTWHLTPLDQMPQHALACPDSQVKDFPHRNQCIKSGRGDYFEYTDKQGYTDHNELRNMTPPKEYSKLPVTDSREMEIHKLPDSPE